MIYVSHRVNTIEELKKVKSNFGVEVDLRSYKNQLILHHDPFEAGENFETWLHHYNNKFLILNIKEEGLEQRIIDLMKKHKISNYFFLDQSFPFLIKYKNLCSGRTAIRVSEYESVETALTLAGEIKWIWLDCFSSFPIDSKTYKLLKEANYKLCLVSPELQGRLGENEILSMINYMKSNDIAIDAVCTKVPDYWAKVFER